MKALSKSVILAAVSAVAAVSLTGCAGVPAQLTRLSFIPANQSGPQVVLTNADPDGLPTYEFPAGRSGSLELEFTGPYGNATGLGKCTLTWANVGQSSAEPTVRDGSYVLTYDLPGGVAAGPSQTDLECDVASGANSGTKYSTSFTMTGIYEYVYWSAGDEILRARISDAIETADTFVSGLSQVHAIAVYGDHVYFTNSQGIGRVDLDGRNVDRDYIPLNKSPRELAVYSKGTGIAMTWPDPQPEDQGPPYVRLPVPADYIDALTSRGQRWYMAFRLPMPGMAVEGAAPKVIATGPATGLAVIDRVPYWSSARTISRLDGDKTVTVATADHKLLDLAYDGKQLLALEATDITPVLMAFDPISGKRSLVGIAYHGKGGLAVGGGEEPVAKVRIRSQKGDLVKEIAMPAYGSPEFREGTQIRFQIENFGTDWLQVRSCSIRGEDAAAFTITSSYLCDQIPLAAGQTTTTSLAFTPSGRSGNYRAVVRLNGAINPRGYIDVPISTSWTAPTPSPSGSPSPSPTAAPVFSVAPSSHDFGTHAVGYPSESMTFTITNSGTAPMTIAAGGVTLEGTNKDDYDLVPGACDEATLAPTQSCTLDVLFSPVAVGNRTAQLQVVTSAVGSPHSVTLTGNAVAPALSFAPDPVPTLDVELGRPPATGQVMVTNDSPETVRIASINLTGVDSAKFTLEAGSSCSVGPLPAGAACMIEYSFGPTVADLTGDYTAAVGVTHNGAGSPLEIPITGKAIPPIGS